jgi:hypothetical protein
MKSQNKKNPKIKRIPQIVDVRGGVCPSQTLAEILSLKQD